MPRSRQFAKLPPKDALIAGNKLANSLWNNKFCSSFGSKKDSCCEQESCPTAKPLCKFHMENRCEFGDDCWYSHDLPESQASVPSSKFKTKVCKHFLNGWCKLEDECHFIHPDEDDASESDAVAADAVDADASDPDEVDDDSICEIFQEQGRCTLRHCMKIHPDQIIWNNPVPDEASNASKMSEDNDADGDDVYEVDRNVMPTTPSKICKHWANGNCLRGSSCSFLHPKDLSTTTMKWVPKNQQPAVAESTSDTPIEPPRKLSYPCWHFSSKGVCKMGDECKFVHDSSNCVSNTKPKYPYPCKHFSTKGWCILEDECQFSHECVSYENQYGVSASEVVMPHHHEISHYEVQQHAVPHYEVQQYTAPVNVQYFTVMVPHMVQIITYA
uniref:C3H1-type domain-containing protein n=1 Tax=viral metagenome TaxID=1070528 RepID=A0A6C0EEW0_9ZZZZ